MSRIRLNQFGLLIILLLASSGCAPKVNQEPPQINVKIHNERVIDQHIQKLASSEGRKQTAFAEAARWGRIFILKELLAEGIDINAEDEYGRVALVLASIGGEIEAMRFLIQEGADVNACSRNGKRTPLIGLLGGLHTTKTYFAGTELLIDAKAVLSPTDQDGLTAIDWAQLRVDEGRLPKEFMAELKRTQLSSRLEASQ